MAGRIPSSSGFPRDNRRERGSSIRAPETRESRIGNRMWRLPAPPPCSDKAGAEGASENLERVSGVHTWGWGWGWGA